MQRLKVPPAINQFSRTLDRNTAAQLFKLLHKYRPEEKLARKQRLLKLAAVKAKKESTEPYKKPLTVSYSLHDVTGLVEEKKAKLVVIAHDVNPIELVVWLPTLCRKMDVPYVIVKSKSRLGQVVHKKTTSVLAFTNVNKEDKNDFAQLVTAAREMYNDNIEHRKQWGGGKLSAKSAARISKAQRLVAKEAEARQKAV